jgi:CheY-like chemotaxis protein
MPHMDGFELLPRVRGLGREVASVSAIACTAVDSKEDIARTKSAGFQAHVTKPMDPRARRDHCRRHSFDAGD